MGKRDESSTRNVASCPTSVNSSSSSAVFAGLFLTGGPDTRDTAPPWDLSTKALDVPSDMTVMSDDDCNFDL